MTVAGTTHEVSPRASIGQPRRRRRRTWSFTESSLVSCSASKKTTTTAARPTSAVPTKNVTPSPPPSDRQTLSETSLSSSHTARQLDFSAGAKKNKQKRKPCSSAPRIPVELALQQGPRPPSPERLLQQQSLSSRQKSSPAATKQRHRTTRAWKQWYSLGPLLAGAELASNSGSLARSKRQPVVQPLCYPSRRNRRQTSANEPEATKMMSTTKTAASHRTDSTDELRIANASDRRQDKPCSPQPQPPPSPPPPPPPTITRREKIPPDLAAILAPVIPKQPMRSIREILQDDIDRPSQLVPKNLPVRACRATPKNYSEFSDDDDEEEQQQQDVVGIPREVAAKSQENNDPSSSASSSSPSLEKGSSYSVERKSQPRVARRAGSVTQFDLQLDDHSSMVSTNVSISKKEESSSKRDKRRRRRRHNNNKRDYDTGSTAIKSIIKVSQNTQGNSKKRKKKSKVRFAPSTTTFSVKIRVQTSSPKRKGRNSWQEPNQSPHLLSESAVQSIANSITQACLSQAGVQGEEAVIVTNSNNTNDDDDDDENSAASESSETSSSSADSRDCPPSDEDEGSDILEETRMGKLGKESGKRSRAAVHSSKMDHGDHLRRRTEPMRREDGEDTRSVFSEVSKLSMADWTGNDGSGIPREVRKRMREPSSRPEHGINEQVEYPMQEDLDERTEDVDRSPSQLSPRDRTTAMSSTETLLGSLLLKQPPEHGTSPTSKRQKKRTFHGYDSLAGLSLASSATGRGSVPAQVTLQSRRRAKRLTMKDRNKQKKRLQARTESLARRAPAKKRLNAKIDSLVNRAPAARAAPAVAVVARPPQHLPDETVVTDRSASTAGGSPRTFQSKVKAPCGKCEGCELDYDCLVCRNCRQRNRDGFRSPETDCSERVCVHLRRTKQVDSLGSMFQKTKRPEVDPEMDSEGEGSDDKGAGQFSSNRSLASASLYSAVSQSSQHSYQSNRYWKSQKTHYQQFLLEKEKVEAKKAAKSATKPKGTRRRKGKNAKNPMHNFALPDGDGSFASWREGCLAFRALKHYDEADQEWE